MVGFSKYAGGGCAATALLWVMVGGEPATSCPDGNILPYSTVKRMTTFLFFPRTTKTTTTKTTSFSIDCPFRRPCRPCRGRLAPQASVSSSSSSSSSSSPSLCRFGTCLQGWVQESNGEWQWRDDNGEEDADEDSPWFAAAGTAVQTETDPATGFVTQTTLLDGIEALKYSDSVDTVASTPTLPSGQFRPKQSLGQNYLRDGNTVAKIVRAYINDATLRLESSIMTQVETTTGTTTNPKGEEPLPPPKEEEEEEEEEEKAAILRAVELGPGAGALTDRLVEALGVVPSTTLTCIEIDARAVQLLKDKHPTLEIRHQDVLQTNYVALAQEQGGPLSVVGNLPYYITSQILFALADASHFGAVQCATVTMQWEVALRVVAPTKCKDYGILSVVFQLYADCKLHFKIPPTVFYPQPKVDSALVGFQFVGPAELQRRLGGVQPLHLRRVLTTTFQQRRKTIRKSLQKLLAELPDREIVEARLQQASVVAPPPLLNCTVEARRRDKERRQEQRKGVSNNGKSYFASALALPLDFLSKRPEELTPGQFVELTRLVFGPRQESDHDDLHSYPLGNKVWRKLKHGTD